MNNGGYLSLLFSLWNIEAKGDKEICRQYFLGIDFEVVLFDYCLSFCTIHMTHIDNCMILSLIEK